MKKRKGFTVIELLVVIFIIITLNSISFVYYREGEKQLTFQRTVSKILQDIRRVQEMTIAGKKCPANVSCGQNTLYGIEFSKNSSSYFLYIDLNGNGLFDQSSDHLLEEGKLEAGTKIEEIKINDTFQDKISLTFLPPDPITLINGNPVFSTADIKITRGNANWLIKVNKFGLVAGN